MNERRRRLVLSHLSIAALLWLRPDGGATASVPSAAVGGWELGGVAERLQTSRSDGDMDQVVLATDRQRADLVKQLAKLLHETTSDAVKRRACSLLGEFGGAEAAAELSDNIDLGPGVNEITKIPAGGAYPCEGALIGLGTRGEEAVLRLLESTASDSKRQHGVGALIVLHGKAGADRVLRQEVARTRGSAAAKLQAALALIAKGEWR